MAGHLDWPGFAGDLLRSHDGQWVAVESARNSGETAPVYNMRVEEYHTYFVGDTHWGFSVWAHNANYRVPGGSQTTREVDVFKLSPSPAKPFAALAKLERMGPFDWKKYTPIIVEQDGTRLTIQEGMTRVEAATRAGITKLPAYVFPKR